MDDRQLAKLAALKQSARGQILLEIRDRSPNLASMLDIREIDEHAIAAHEHWFPAPHDFGWERIPKWKSRRTHKDALDIALWHEGQLAGLCWASPLGSKEKIMVLYLQRNPDNRLATKGYVAPLCLGAVRYYALMMGLRWVVIRDPLPQARMAYELGGFRQIKGIGLAYDLTGDYSALNHEDNRHAE